MAKRNKHKDTTVGFVALGCPKNIVDSEKMLANIGQAGFVLTGDADNADVVVINTCGFIEPAKQEAIEAISRAIKQKKKGRVKKVIVAGCLAERMGRELAKEVEGIDALVCLAAREDIADVIKQSLAENPKTDPAASIGLYLNRQADEIMDDRGRLLLTPRHWAYLQISEGCNRKCSFCTIPAIRGPYRSKPADIVIAEAEELVENGAVELNIIAQDTNFYGKDKGLKHCLAGLLHRMELIKQLKWIRVMYLYPAGIDRQLIDTFAESEKIVHYIDMPVQHINDSILKKMHRAHTKASTMELIENLRKAIPGIVLRTTLIAGFPGETDAQFEELVDFVSSVKFDALGCFMFYPEQGTPAARLGGQLPLQVKQERVNRLMLRQQEIAFSQAADRIGQELVCLIDGAGGKNKPALGRFYGQAPGIDSICRIDNCTAQAGDFIRTTVTGTDDYDLLVEQFQD